MPTPGPNPTSSTLSRGWTSSRLITERANAALVRAMMMPPNLPSVPVGRPNMRIKVLSSTLIGLNTHLCRCVCGGLSYLVSVDGAAQRRPALAGISARKHGLGLVLRIEGDGVDLVVARPIDCQGAGGG